MPPPPPTHHSPFQVFAAASSSGILETVLRVPGHGVEAPHEIAGRRIVGREIPSHAVLGAAVADQHLAFDDARRTGDRVGLGAVDRIHFPAPAAGAGVEADEATIQRREVDRSLPDGDATVDRIAAGVASPLARDLGVVFPDFLAGLRVERVNDAPHARSEHHAVHDDRGGLQPREACRWHMTTRGRASRRCLHRPA